MESTSSRNSRSPSRPRYPRASARPQRQAHLAKGILLGFLRPYRGGVAVSFVLAAAAMGTGVLIPYLVGRTVDEIGDGGANLWPLAAAVAAAGLLRLAFSVARRLVAGRVSLGVEYDLRNRMYRHLHSLELAFFDGQQTGQLMSRSTVDLQSVRFFLGYGLIFIVQSRSRS